MRIIPASVWSSARAGHTTQAHAARVQTAMPTLRAWQSSAPRSNALPSALLISVLPSVLLPRTAGREAVIKRAFHTGHFV